MKSLISLVLLIFCISYTSIAQKSLLKDQETLDQLKKGLTYMYNYEFEKSKAIFKEVAKKYPKHPVTPLTYSLNRYWKNIPFDYSSKEYEFHNLLLDATIKNAEKLLEKDKDDPEGVFFSLIARSLKVFHAAQMREWGKTISEANHTYKLMKQGFELKETYNEFIFTTGIYNYFREGYPDEHPVLKPLVWPFHKGNKELGIQQLKKAFNECIFTKMEALMYLADIYLNYEKKPNEAIKYSTKLVTISPGNLLYKAYHVIL